MEEIEITGRATRLQLHADIENAEIRMFGLFNQLNDVRQFDISCEAVIVTGSRIAERECVPLYMKRTRHANVQRFLFSDLTPNRGNKPSGGASMDLKGVQDSEEIMWFKNQPKTREFTAKFQALAAEHPDLAAAAQDLQSKRQRLEELEARRRNEGAVGRFLSSDKDEE
ncbi:MAG: hypothetical protein V4603_03670 [Pseudomonadota bacterium]